MVNIATAFVAGFRASQCLLIWVGIEQVGLRSPEGNAAKPEAMAALGT